MFGNGILMFNCTNNFSTDELRNILTHKPKQSQSGANQLENLGYLHPRGHEEFAFSGQTVCTDSDSVPVSKSVNTQHVNHMVGETGSSGNTEAGSASVNINNNTSQTPDILQHKPKYPQYANITARMESFRHWPPGTIQRQEQMTQSGFYYTGKDDLVRCYYCGQGLRNWEPDDDPWIEHARWSPNCNHILMNSGQEFVHTVGEMYGETNGSRITGEAANGQTLGGQMDMKADIKLSLESPTSPLLNTVAARSVVFNGYGEDIVLKAINIYKLDKGSVDFSAKDLLKIIFNLEDGTINYDEIVTMETVLNETELKTLIDGQQQKNDGETELKLESLNAKSLEEENRRLRKQTLCKICKDEKLAVVFLPCGHLVCCTKCAPGLHKCPECHGTIKGSMETLLP